MRVRTVIAIGGLSALVVVPIAQPQGGGTPRPNLVVSAEAEPPDFEVAGGRFRHSFTVGNQGTRAATRETEFRVFLSPDPVRGNDTELRGSRGTRGNRRIRTLLANRQRTRRITLNIPATVRPGFYYLIGCADGRNIVRESSESDNCRISGQQVGINVQERPQPGVPGANGPAGANGPDVDRRAIARTTLQRGTGTVDLATFPKANGSRPDGTATPDEGSTQTKELIKVGPLSFQALCRSTTNGNDQPPTTANPGGNGNDEDGDEAKILVYADNGTMSLNGQTGPRSNIPAGTGTPANDEEAGGEGKHQLIAAWRHPSEPDDEEDDEAFRNRSFRAWPGYVVHSGGTEVSFHLYAGIDIFDVGDNCVFGGLITVVNGPA
jgi:hypothetical protein